MRADLKAADPRLYELVRRLVPEENVLPITANVAAIPRAQMDSIVREQNPEWARRHPPVAGRGGGTGRAGATPPAC